MSAIFGTPVAAILLAIELLLFEFSPRSFIPVALACITGAIGHHFLFGAGPVFPVASFIGVPSNSAITFYAAMGVIIGFLSILVTKITYWIEDFFEKLPVHWMWWPAIGGLFVGIIGYFDSRTLGVGYENITSLLSGSLTLQLVASLCILKFISWAIALGSGTSGGTLAPLLTIGGALGVLIGTVGIRYFPDAGISLPLAALVGMSALFAGASRAFLTSIVFALEATGQTNALLPLLATCTSSFFVSYFLMENTIMTEKIARRGVLTPESYEPDLFLKVNVEDIADDSEVIINNRMNIGEVRTWVKQEYETIPSYIVISNEQGEYEGLISSSDLFNTYHNEETLVGSLVKNASAYVRSNETLRNAIKIMATQNVDVLPVVSAYNKEIAGIISHKNILSVYKMDLDDLENRHVNISLKRKRLKMLIRGQKIVSLFNTAKKKKNGRNKHW